jgi:hypothetical protein
MQMFHDLLMSPFVGKVVSLIDILIEREPSLARER